MQTVCDLAVVLSILESARRCLQRVQSASLLLPVAHATGVLALAGAEKRSSYRPGVETRRCRYCRCRCACCWLRCLRCCSSSLRGQATWTCDLTGLGLRQSPSRSGASQRIDTTCSDSMLHRHWHDLRGLGCTAHSDPQTSCGLRQSAGGR